MRVDPFAGSVPDAVLTDLRERIARTRWPDAAPGEAWSQGVDVDYLRDLLAYWADGFGWRAAERVLNRHRHQVADVDGTAIHFVHHRSKTGGADNVNSNSNRTRNRANTPASIHIPPFLPPGSP